MPSDPPDSSRTSGRGRGRPSTLDRNAVLGAAWKVIARRGLERTRYVDIARESGTPVSTLQNAFGNLEALLLAAVEHVSVLDGAILATLPAAGEATASERMEQLVVGAVAGEGSFEIWLVWLELWRAAARDTELAAHAGEAYAQWWQVTESIIRDGQATGEFTTEESARDLAIATVAAIDGCVVALLLRGGDPLPDEAARIALRAVQRMLAV